MTNDINITIGSDPEFVIMCGDKIENALEIFTRLQKPDYCCECSSPNGDEIEDIYDGDKNYYLGEVINYFDTIDLITDYDNLAIDTLINAFEGKIEDLLKIDKFKEIMLLHNEEYDNNIIDILTQEFIPQTKKEDNKYITFDKYDIVKEILLKESTYIIDIYNLLSDKYKKRFNSSIMDNVVDYLSDFDTLDDLPDEILDRVKELIISNFESDCDFCDIHESYFCSTELGCDEESILGEMRPKYGNNPFEHFDEILKLMKKLNDMLAPEIICHGSDQLQVKAGSTLKEIYRLGGHIHIGFNELEDTGKGLYIQKNIKNFLAIYVGIPLTLIENTEEAIIRHSGYGEFAEARNGEKYFGTEFIMPSSWLVSPEITIGALSLAYVVAYEYIKVMLSKKDTYRNIEYDLKTTKYMNLYNEALFVKRHFKTLTKEIPELYSEIQQMELYPTYKDFIDYIFEMIKQNKVWESDTNILPRWAKMW